MYFAKRLHSDRMEAQRAATALYAELGDALNALDPRKHPNLRAARIGGETIHFTSRLLNHDIYDSLVNSGKITFLEIDIQQHIQDVF